MCYTVYTLPISFIIFKLDVGQPQNFPNQSTHNTPTAFSCTGARAQVADPIFKNFHSAVGDAVILLLLAHVAMSYAIMMNPPERALEEEVPPPSFLFLSFDV